MERTGEIHAITLGTAGGPRYWGGTERFGIATAIVIGDSFYLVDCGFGVGRQIVRAGLEMGALKGIFLTHLHSDHVVDLNGLVLFALPALQDAPGPVPIIGPGDRGALPPVSSGATVAPTPFHRASPTPGTVEMFHGLMEAHATDINDRVLDSLRPSPTDLFEPQDIAIPSDSGYHPNDNPTPDMEPFEVFRDEAVRVTATLVRHPPMAPAFAFRFDAVAGQGETFGGQTGGGSIVVSGDTAPTDNMVRLADRAGLLLHEALDFSYMERRYGGRDDDLSRASLEHHYRSHSSVDDALMVAGRAGVERLALHHLVPGNLGPEAWREAWKRQGVAGGFHGEFHVPDDLTIISGQYGGSAGAG